MQIGLHHYVDRLETIKMHMWAGSIILKAPGQVKKKGYVEIIFNIKITVDNKSYFSYVYP
jgi:hypothetical protein